MGSKLFEVVSLFQCSHQFSWPRRYPDGDYYQVCLACGVEYQYDWATMRRTVRRPRRQTEPAMTADEDRKPPRSHRSWRPRERRLKWTVPAEVRAVGSQEWLTATTENISRSGMLLHCEHPIERATAVEIKLEMPAEICGQANAIVLCQGQAARTSGGEAGAPYRIACAIEQYRFVSLPPRAAAQ